MLVLLICSASEIQDPQADQGFPAPSHSEALDRSNDAKLTAVHTEIFANMSSSSSIGEAPEAKRVHSNADDAVPLMNLTVMTHALRFCHKSSLYEGGSTCSLWSRPIKPCMVLGGRNIHLTLQYLDQLHGWTEPVSLTGS